jgi:hypothetical protein
MKIIAVALLAVSASANAVLMCNNGGNSPEVLWYVGEPRLSLDISNADAVTCYADGLELAYIGSRFEGLPLVKVRHLPRSTIWRGQNAIFILDNLE